MPETRPSAPKRAWWPLFAREKARVGHESIIGWLDDWKRRKPQASVPIATPATAAPAPAARQPMLEQAPAPELDVKAPRAPAEPPGTITPPPQPEPSPPPAAAPEPAPTPLPEIEPTPLRAEAPAPAVEDAAPKEGLFSRLKRGLSRSTNSLTGGIAQIFGGRKIDDDALEDLEDLLISADLGVAAAGRLAEKVRALKIEGGTNAEDIKCLVADEVERILAPAEQPFAITAQHRPFVVMMVGVNGTGKTTTIGKLAQKLKAEGHKVLMVAGDTFRAAAIEQLSVWGERAGVEVLAREVGADAAGLAFEALEKAQNENFDVVFIDTAGRLQNKAGLMAELEKINRVLKKRDEAAPHAVIQVLDATTGQNAISQVEAFQKTAGVTGLIMTKLDGTARGGILVPLTERYGLPIHAIGVGESADDLQAFNAALFARALTGQEAQEQAA